MQLQREKYKIPLFRVEHCPGVVGCLQAGIPRAAEEMRNPVTEPPNPIERVRPSLAAGPLPTPGAARPMLADGATGGTHSGDEPTADL